MVELSRASIFRKLNKLGHQSLESSTSFCKLRGNPHLEIEHWLHQIIQQSHSDIHCIVRAFELDAAKVSRDLVAALDRLPLGASSISAMSPHLIEMVKQAWTYSSLMFNDTQIRTGHLMVALGAESNLRHVLPSLSSEFDKISQEALTDRFHAIVESSPETVLEPRTDSAATVTAAHDTSPSAVGQQALEQFTIDLTAQAHAGEIDPVVGRDDEIRQIIDILMRRRQNNPILTGEAGVGKTAVVEGFALRLARGDVPPSIRNVTLRTLDLGLLKAGASMKGEFEDRLRRVIDEVQGSATPIVLFVDEAHTLIGAGGSAGTGDAANLLKPALARGTLRTIAATTWSEYKQHFESDAALTRRFQLVKVDEPDEDRALLMMRSVAQVLEQHHQVHIYIGAVEAAVSLSHRYLPDRQLPDKSVSVLDTACARVAISHHAEPVAVEAARRQVEAIEIEQNIVDRQIAMGQSAGARADDIAAESDQAKSHYSSLEAHWQQEKALVDHIVQIQQELSPIAEKKSAGSANGNVDEIAHPRFGQATGAGDEQPSAEDVRGVQPYEVESSPTEEVKAARRQELLGYRERLAALQGERPLMTPAVDEQAVADVISSWTGIPVGRMVKNEIQAVLELGDALNERVVGQRHALDLIARRVQTTRAGLDDPNKPIGVFMLCGPSGVGKTETGLALSEALYGADDHVITINMSEFQEAHTVATLKGSPPGYVGYGRGGVLTEAVRRKPYSVVLLDEVEKAHPDVLEIFYQVFDKGFMDDAEGRRIDFKNTIILLTSNVGTELIASLCEDPELMPEADALAEALREPLLKEFPPAFLGRMVVIPYYPLRDEILDKIINLKLNKIEQRVESSHNVPFSYDDALVDLVRSRCTEVESGGRMIDAVLTNTVLPTLSREVLNRLIEGDSLTSIHVSAKDNEFRYECV